ncbi:adenosylcobinamide-phosphate synthase CbiB [Halomarina salina]|uniref:Probable cobalamin biosynthesis protein CobD n=1 Tax=Halomarina salina TaxID=1872699 RepID=A0ABD5RGZ3_9EURY|nr:adenosylcobinamide-phosphate synthase CbiB [Halomarina salina]
MGTVAVALAVVLDRLVAEPPARVHPVALLGRLAAPLDRTWGRPTLVGAAVALVVPLTFAGTVAGTTALAGRSGPVVATLVAGCWLFCLCSLRMLLTLSTDVLGAIENDVAHARDAIRGLVGRDTATLSPGELRSAAVESVAENLADGLVAPLFAFALGAQVSLAVAAGAAAWVKGVNTLDSMLGYPSKPHGTASARLDDAVMWLPARLSAVLVALAALDPRAVRRSRRWAGDPPSPNSGWPMATLAAVLGVRLAKRGSYVLNPSARLPTAGDAREGVRVVGVAGGLAAVLAGVLAW